jgi:hypothetical protein
MRNWNKEKIKDSEKKVKNVIKGFVSKFGMEEMTLISDKHDSVIFDGKIEDFLHPNEVMKEYSEEMQNEHAHRVINHNDKKVFIFI